jgi:hypothetical protein
MINLHDIIPQVEAKANEAGVSPAHLCRVASGNPRLFTRLKSRIAQIERDMSRIDAAFNMLSPSATGCGSADGVLPAQNMGTVGDNVNLSKGMVSPTGDSQ